MEKLFRRSLADLVRGIRANKKDEHKFITRAIQEIKDELKLANKDAKVVAVQKLTYVRADELILGTVHARTHTRASF